MKKALHNLRLYILELLIGNLSVVANVTLRGPVLVLVGKRGGLFVNSVIYAPDSSPEVVYD